MRKYLNYKFYFEYVNSYPFKMDKNLEQIRMPPITPHVFHHDPHHQDQDLII